MKKILSIVFALIMILTTIGALPINAFAIRGNYSFGDTVYHYYDYNTDVLTFSGKGTLVNQNIDDNADEPIYTHISKNISIS